MKCEPRPAPVRREWSDPATARAWEKWARLFSAQSRAATELLIEAARIAPEMKVLDLAGGTGDPALDLARAVGPRGRITATDAVLDMLAVAEARSRAAGLGNLVFQEARAEALPFPDQRFDAITCRLGVMYFAELDRALGECRRVLAPGARAAFVAWGRVTQPYFACTLGVLHARGLVPAPEKMIRFRFADPRSLAGALEAAGLSDVHAETRVVPWPSGTIEEAWQSLCEMRSPFREAVAKLDAEARAGVDGEVREAMRPFEQQGTVTFPAEVVLAWGTRGQRPPADS